MTKQKISDCLDLACETIQSNATEKQKWIVKYLNSTQKERILDDCILVDDLLKNNTDAKVLDMGSAPFYTVLALQNFGYNISAIDISPERFGTLIEKANLDVIKCNFEKEILPFADNTFDLILFSEVFEHLRIDLIFTISEIKRVLKPGGKFILSTPNFFEFNRAYNLFIHGKTANIYTAYNKLHELGHMGHVREYTRNDVILFLEKMDFQINRSYFRGFGAKKNKSWREFRGYWAQKLFPSFRIWFVVISSKK